MQKICQALQRASRVPFVLAKHSVPCKACYSSVAGGIGWFSSFLQQFKLTSADATTPPVYPQHPSDVQLGHVAVTDSYKWLSDYDKAEPYLRQEQQYYQQAARAWASTADQLLQEMKQNCKQIQVHDLPERVGPYQYLTIHNPHGQDTIVRQHTATGRQQVLLSATLLKQDAAWLSQLLGASALGSHIGTLKLSQNQQLLAYSLELSEGSDEYCCLVRDIGTAKVLEGTVLPGASSFEWSADGTCLYYSMPDELGRPSKVFKHTLSSHTCKDELLYHEPDPKHFVTLTRTKDWHYVVINTHSKLSSEVWLINAHNPTAKPVCIQQRQLGVEYFVEHHQGHILMLTNSSSVGKAPGSTSSLLHHHCQAAAPHSSLLHSNGQLLEHDDAVGGAAVGEYCLVATAASAVLPAGGNAAKWKVVLPEQAESVIVDMDVFDSCAVLHQLQAAKPRLLLLKLAEQAQQAGTTIHTELHMLESIQVHLPDWVLCVRPGINQDYHATVFSLYASSPAVPEVPLQVDLSSGQIHAYGTTQHKLTGPKQGHAVNSHSVGSVVSPIASVSMHTTCGNPVGSNGLASDLGLTCKLLWALASDGTKVPLTLLHAAGLPCDGRHPLLVEVYGAYGQVLEADYRAYRLPLLQRGWSVALAHVRGGGELGRRWHAGGRQLSKPNSVTDLMACLQLLFDLQVTSPGNVAGHAASAGALTLGAAVNAQPSWFSGVVLEAPFVDWMGEMSDNASTARLLTLHETDEWGDVVENARVADMIRGMCPYTNMTAEQLPGMLLTAGLRDTRVPYWVPAKYVAKARQLRASALKEHHRPLVLRFENDAGHFSIGTSGGSLDDIAEQYAFLLHCSEY
eukprot:GHRR01007732.1.p1 GENE.GHRR01007732.1~~GHRR01007732.1.p1  ORF type:complete len:851 (+),score=260.67 GHRR01007732.1:215-2767(+)